MPGRRLRFAAPCALALSLAAAARGAPEAPVASPLSLEAALAEARRANARLPVAALDTKASEEQVRSAKGGLLPRLDLQGDLQVAPSRFAYGASGSGGGPVGEERLQLVATQPLYQGGQLRAQVRGAEAQARASRAAFRIAEKDLDLEVRTRFSEVLKAEEDVRVRGEGLERLRTYLAAIRARRASGEGLQADVLKTEARLATEQADAEDAARQLRQRRMELNDSLGRDPPGALELVPLPPPPAAELAASEEGPAAPDAGPAPAGAPWRQAPELSQAQAQLASAEATADAALAGRRPHLGLSADVGILGGGFASGLPGAGLSERLRNDLGASVTLTLSWSLFDFGIYQGQLGQARARAEQARSQAVVLERQARLQWEQAREDVRRRAREVELRGRALPLARDAYLSAESLYRGGSGTALEVLDAYTGLIGASQAWSDAVLAYRVASATALRWGTP